ncbi:ABC transporter ATP-binding protein [Pseudooceanicola sp.]|uniref:ABC transporter ATP-binding protein n=1 Tax=Pseudooceanicola sp. TaxID=1914328 RepID=UPI002621DAEC|nr:ABC transporter ATP-binding protein [Pseudooceanicola sp.]MDF1854976.1 ABC transporter ATP-binding protein [Pseudooceanicola sp.]
MRPEHLIDAFRPADSPPPQSLLRFIGWALRGAFPALFLAVVLSSLAGGMEAGTALILGRVIDRAGMSGPEGFFLAENAGLLLLAFGFFLIARPLFFGLSSASNSIIIAPNVDSMVLARLNRWTLGQSVVFFDNDFAGRIAQKQLQTARALTDVTVEVINTIAFALASLVGAVLLIGSIDARLALGFAIWLSLYFALIRYFLPRIRARAKDRAAARALVTGQIVDTITNIKTVKLFAHDAHEDRAALGAIRGFRDRVLAFGYLSASFRVTLNALAGTLPLFLWSRGEATIGDAVAAGTVAMRVAQMTGWVSFGLMTTYANLGEVEDGMRTLTRSVRLEDAPDAQPLTVSGGRVTFEDVGFAYGREKGGVQGITLEIAPGEKLGIVGASGAGKSTLVALLMRLYDPEQGRILIDGQDIRGVTQDSLRQQIGMVTQETAMFNRSARENILYGRPDAGEDALIDAAEKAEADDFIADLADHTGREGYDARLGERGVKLSGGQRQRIALARAILKDAPILVLDEATSALDSEVEAAIQSALERVMQGKTVLAVAHRLSTISRMDRIAVLDQGQVVETGSHDELLAQGGLYARYWARQSGGFLGADEAE